MSYYYLVEFNDGHSFINKLEKKLVPPYRVMPDCVCVWEDRDGFNGTCPYTVWGYDINLSGCDRARIQELSEEDTFAYLL